MAGKNPGSEIARPLQREIPARLGGRISGNVAEETPVGRAGETGTRQRARIPRANAVDRPGNGLAVEIADRERTRVVAEIVDVCEPSRGEIAGSAVDHGPEGVTAEGPDAGCGQGDARDARHPGVDMRRVLADRCASGSIRGVEHSGPVTPLQELALLAQTVRQKAVRHRAR